MGTVCNSVLFAGYRPSVFRFIPAPSRRVSLKFDAVSKEEEIID